jgi:hypothetical protein
MERDALESHGVPNSRPSFHGFTKSSENKSCCLLFDRNSFPHFLQFGSLSRYLRASFGAASLNSGASFSAISAASSKATTDDPMSAL